MTLEFFKEINPEVFLVFLYYPQKSKWSCTPRCVQFHLVKDNDETWSQLLKVRASLRCFTNQDKNQYKNLLKIDWDLWADSDDEDEGGMGNFQLPPNFQDMMSSMNMQGDMNYPSADCGCGHDHCGCGHDHCECESESDNSDEMPPLEEVN